MTQHLTAKDKQVVTTFWSKIASKADDLGAESMLVTVYPQTKTYFTHWKDTSASSTQVRKHGITVMGGVREAIGKIDNLTGGLLTLSELHAFTLRVDPANFKLFTQCMLLVSAIMFPNDFTPEVHLAMDKFMAALARALSEKYR
uniref:Globin domain-containing protein n=1 Tax=Mola mola TaxID=94237 RepID=A0A3Q3WKQ1_MOLML